VSQLPLNKTKSKVTKTMDWTKSIDVEELTGEREVEDLPEPEETDI